MRRKRHLHGYALIVALIALVGASLAVTLAVGRAQVDAQREREEELLFAGDQYRRAIADYFMHPPTGQAAVYPSSLNDLIEDRRGPVRRRWLRRLYPDPVSGLDWDLEQAQGRIVGIHSASDRAPLRHGGFELSEASFEKAASYQDWHFTAAQVMKEVATQAAVAPPNDTSSDPPPVTMPPGYVDPYNVCYSNFVAPAAACYSQKPPPKGHDPSSCSAAYQQAFDACVAAIPGASAAANGN